MNTTAAHKHMQVVLLHHTKNVRESVLNITHCCITNVRHKRSFSFPSSVFTSVTLNIVNHGNVVLPLNHATSYLSFFLLTLTHFHCSTTRGVLAVTTPLIIFGSYYTYYNYVVRDGGAGGGQGGSAPPPNFRLGGHCPPNFTHTAVLTLAI